MSARPEEPHSEATVSPVRSAIDTRQEDAYWSRHYWRERYYRPDCEYEDYAPAYCVGYVGYGQYGGAYDDAEKCLCANWERIKGDSRLTEGEARLAIRAAWDHAARVAARPAHWRDQLRQLASRAVPNVPLAPMAH